MNERLTSGSFGLALGGKTSAQLFSISSRPDGNPRESLQVNWLGFCAPSGVSWTQNENAEVF